MKLNIFMGQIYGKKYHIFVGLLSGLAFITAGAQFVVTYCMGKVIDAASMGYERTVHYFLFLATALAVFIGSFVLLSFGSGKMAARFCYKLQCEIGRKLCRALYQEIEGVNEGELLTINVVNLSHNYPFLYIRK